MGAPLKDIYNESFLRSFSKKIHTVYNQFNIEGFISTTMDETWEELELKARMRRISLSLGTYLPKDYKEAINILFNIDEECTGFPYLFFPDFVEVYGQADEHLELSIKALERFTMRSSSEFAVRPFILKNPEVMMVQMEAWAKHPNEHVRRLASEGSRPRLPWGMVLPVFKKDPTPVLSVLEILKNDPSLYVRKSVANNLNDISKDNPDIVIETARRWKGVSANTDWIIRQGCRTLVKKADPSALELFGYASTKDESLKIEKAILKVNPENLSIGADCELNYELYIKDCNPTRIRIEYRIDFIKARGTKSPKAFLLSDKTISGDVSLNGSRKHSFKDLTTRKHYPGEHKITLMVNGKEVAGTSIILE